MLASLRFAYSLSHSVRLRWSQKFYDNDQLDSLLFHEKTLYWADLTILWQSERLASSCSSESDVFVITQLSSNLIKL